MPEVFPYATFTAPADQHPYTAFPNNHILYFPLIDLKVRVGGRATPSITVLVDSGAAYCMFDRDAASALGIQVTSGKRTQVLGVSGSPFDLYFFDVELLINSITLQCYAGFLNQPFPAGPNWVGLLGHHDFFSRIPVTLDVGNLEIRIG
jgi:hypothetical protein